MARVLAGLVLLLGLGARSAVHAAPGDRVGAELQVNTYTTGGQTDPSVAPDGSGGFVVVWSSAGSSGTDSDADSIQAQRFAPTGLPVGGEFQINTYTTSYQRQPVVAPDGAGGFVVVWQSDGSAQTDTSGHSIQGQRFSAAGLPAGGEFQVNTYTTGGQDTPFIAALGGGGFVVVWQSEGSGGTDTSGQSIQGQLFDAAGAPLGGQFQVNTYTTFDQRYAGVVAVGAAAFVVVWQSDASAGSDTSDRSIQGQRFDVVTGNSVGGQFQVNTYTPDTQDVPGIGSDGSDGYVVVWESSGSAGSDTSGFSTQTRHFNTAGVPSGAEFQANTYTTGAQSGYAAGPDGAGGYVVLWESTGSETDASDYSVHARRFDVAGLPVGGEFQVNTYTTGAQTFARTAPDGAGGFVVVWRSAGSSGSDSSDLSIHAQRFEGTSTPTTTTSTTAPDTGTTSTTLASQGETLEGRKLQLNAKPGHPEKSRLSMVSKDDDLTLGRGNDSGDDPVLHGGRLTLSSDSAAGDFSGTQDLAGSWKYVGKVGQGRGYKWKSRTSAIRSVVIKSGKLVIAGRGGGLGFDLDDDPDPVQIGLAIGAHRYCLTFGGDQPQFKPNKLYRAKRAPAPAICP